MQFYVSPSGGWNLGFCTSVTAIDDSDEDSDDDSSIASTGSQITIKHNL
jgi:hypothetical protein